jgi:organic radical activating enzyme
LTSPSVPKTEPRHRAAEVYLFDTCTMKCGYCWLAESGRVADALQLAPFRRIEHVEQIATFFNSRTTPQDAWVLLLTGGEPLLMPNLGRLCTELFRHGNKVAFYTSLFVDEGQANFRFLCDCDPSNVDYVMASFHPEAEANEGAWFRKVEMLKQAGHKVFLRFVGHPDRLHRLEELSGKCQELDVAFYPTPLLSDRYPAAYSDEQRSRLSSHFASTSQFIQLAGGIDTGSTYCFAGSKIIAVNLQTGNITPCISVSSPSLGNIYENRLSLFDTEIACTEPGINCVCDVHYQQDVVIGAADSGAFTKLKRGFSPPARFDRQINDMKSNGIRFYGSEKAGIGGVQDDSQLYYSIQEVKDSLKRNGVLGISHRSFRITGDARPLFRLEDAAPCNSAVIRGEGPIRIETPAERWAYAAQFPLCAQGSRDAKTFVVRLEYSIEHGKLGIGCVTADGRAYVGEGEKIAMEGDSQSDITVDLADEAAWLVIRNVAGDGERSIIRLTDIRTFAAEPATAVQV